MTLGTSTEDGVDIYITIGRGLSSSETISPKTQCFAEISLQLGILFVPNTSPRNISGAFYTTYSPFEAA